MVADIDIPEFVGWAESHGWRWAIVALFALGVVVALAEAIKAQHAVSAAEKKGRHLRGR